MQLIKTFQKICLTLLTHCKYKRIFHKLICNEKCSYRRERPKFVKNNCLPLLSAESISAWSNQGSVMCSVFVVYSEPIEKYGGNIYLSIYLIIQSELWILQSALSVDRNIYFYRNHSVACICEIGRTILYIFEVYKLRYIDKFIKLLVHDSFPSKLQFFLF